MNTTPQQEQLFRRMAAAGALSAGCAVALGAFGAHGLRSVLAQDMLAVYETAVRYQMYHALGLLGAAAAGLSAHAERRLARWACLGFCCGTVLFSGSLYALALSGIRAFGAVTPLGGLAFIAAWILLCAGFLRAGQQLKF